MSATMTASKEAKRTPVPMNGVDTPTLFATINAVGAQPELAKFQFRAKSRWLTGTHSESTMHGFFGRCPRLIRCGAPDAEPVRLLEVGSNDRATGSSDRSSKSDDRRVDGSAIRSAARSSAHGKRVSFRAVHRALGHQRQDHG